MLPVDSLHHQTQPGVLRGHKATNSPCPKYVKPLQGLSTRKSNDCQQKNKYTHWKLYISNHTNRQALHINNTSETATKTVHLTTNLKTIPRFLSGSNDLHRFRSRTSQMPKTSPTLGSMTFNTSSWVFLDHAGLPIRETILVSFTLWNYQVMISFFNKQLKKWSCKWIQKWYLHKTFFGINSGSMAFFCTFI